MASIVEQILLSINASVSGAAGVSQLTGSIGGLTSKLVGLNQGMQVVGQVTAGVNQLVNQMKEWADASNKAATDTRVFELTLGRFGIAVEGANGAAQRLADKFGLSVESVKGSMTNLIRAGFHDMGQLEEVMTGAAASAIAFGRSASDGFDRVGDAAVTGLSAALNSIGISENLGPAFDKYAKSLGKTADELTDLEKAQTLANLVTKATRTEVDALGSIQNDYVRSQQAASLAQNEFNKAMGALTLPLVTQFNRASAESVTAIVEMVKAYSKGEDGLGKLAAKFPLLNSVMGKIGPEGERMKAALSGAWDAIRSTYDTVLVPIFERLEPLAKRVWSEVPRLVTAAGRLIGETFLLIQSLWNNVLKPVWDALAPIVQAAWGQVVRILGGAFDFISGVFGTIRRLLDGDWKGAWETAKNTVGNALLKIQDALAELAPKVWKAITDIATGVWDKAKMIGRNLRDGIMAPLLHLREALQVKVLEAVNGMLSAIPQPILDKLGLGKGVPGAGQALNDTRAEQGNIQQREAARAAVKKLDANTQATMFFRAIFGQESGGNYGAINTRTGALGKYQVMPQHLVDNQYDPARNTRAWLESNWNNPGKPGQGWDYQNGGFQVTPKQFLETPEIQEAIAQAQMAANLQKRLTEAGGNLEKAIKEAAKDWYGRGAVAPGEPTPDQYAESVYQRFLKASGAPLTPTAGRTGTPAAKGTSPTPTVTPQQPDAPVAPSAESVRKSVEAQIKDILARVDLKLIGKDAAVKLLAQIDADATRIARKQGTGWQEYAATAKTAASAIEGLKKGNSAAKEAKDILGALSVQYEYAGKTGLPAYVAGLNAFIAAQDRAAKSAKAGSKEQIEAQANVNRARQLLKDSAGPKGEVVVSDADLKKYSAAAREVAKLEAAIPKSTDTAWVARAQARIAAYNAQGEAAQKVLGIIQGTSSRQQEIDNQAAEDLKQQKADQEAAAKTLTGLTQEQLQQRVDGQEAAEKKIVGLRDAALKAAGADAQARLGIEQNAAAALKRQAQNTAEAQLILAKRTAEEAYRTTISGIPEKASQAQVKAITEAAQKVRSGSISGAYTTYYSDLSKSAEEGRDRVTAAQDALTASLQAGVDAGNAALASLDTSKLSGRELAGAAQLLIPAEKTFDALYIRIIAMQGELAKPGVADAWGDSIAELGRRGRLTADQIGILKTAISGLAAIDANLQEFGGVSTDVNTGDTVYQTEDQLRGIGVAAENARDDFFDLGNAAQNAISLTRAELDGLLTTSKLLPEQIEAIARAWADFNGPDLATPGAMLGGLINDLQTAQDAFDSGGTGLEETLARFDVLRGVAASIDSDAARGLVSYIDQFTTAWRELRQETSNSEATGAMLGGLIDDLQTAQDAFDSGGATLEDTLSRFESLRAVAEGIDSDAARGLVNYIDQFTASWKELGQTLSASEVNGAMLGNLIDEMQGVQDAFDLGGAGLEDTLTKFEALRAKAASIDDDGARGLVAYIDQFTTSWKELRQETSGMEADGSAIGGLIDQLQAAEDAFYKGGASISDTRIRLADLREQLTLIGGPVATALIGAVDEMTAGFDRAAEAADTFYAALNPEGPIPEAVGAALARLDDVAQGFESGTVSAADFGAATLSTAKELDKMAKAADLAGKPDLANSIRQTAAALRSVTPEVARYMDKLGKFAEYAGYVQELAGAFSGLASAVGNDDLAANLDGVANFAGKAIALAGDVVRILANPADVGAWVGAITKIVSGIADAIGGFQKARAEAKKLAEDFNKQFNLIDASTFSSFTTRSRGFFADLFGGGPEVVKQINESAAAIAKTIETGVLGGFSNGIKAFLNGTGTMLDAIREGVRGAIIDAITQAVIQGAIIKGALGSLLTELTNGLAAGTDVSGVIAQIGAALPGIAKGLETTLKPLKDAVDRALPASTSAGSAGSSGASFGSGSSTFQAGTPAVVIDVLTQTRDLLKGANDASRLMVDAARSLGGHVDRFGDYVDKLNGPHNSATAGAR